MRGNIYPKKRKKKKHFRWIVISNWYCERKESFPNQVLSYLEMVCVIVVHSSLGQRLMRHEWETSLPDVGLSKSLRTKAQRHFQRGQYLIGERFVPPTKRHLLGFKGKPPPSPFIGSCVTRRSALSQHEVAVFETYSTSHVY